MKIYLMYTGEIDPSWEKCDYTLLLIAQIWEEKKHVQAWIVPIQGMQSHFVDHLIFGIEIQDRIDALYDLIPRHTFFKKINEFLTSTILLAWF